MDGITWLALIVGVALTWLLNLHVRDNPAAIPIARVASRALPGIILFILLGTIFSTVVMLLTILRVPAVEQNSTLRLLTTLITGFAVSQTPKLKDRLLTRDLIKRYPLITSCIQWIDESSRLYCVKIIDREERKLSFELLSEHGDARQCAIHRLFEFHLIEIARHECAQLRKEREPLEPALNIFSVRDAQVKLRFFTRFVGYRVALDHIHRVAEDPLMILKTWPVSPEDRRANSPNNGQGKRKYEQPYVKAYVLGHF